MGTPTTRLAGIDNLRFVVVFLVIVLYAGRSFLAGGPAPAGGPGVPGLAVLVDAVDVPALVILFFIAGYFAVYSLRRSGSGRFFQNKVRRVGVPWVVGAAVLAPPTMYLAVSSRGIPPTLFEFWTGPYWGAFYQQSVYWFLGVLFWMLVVLAGLYRIPRFARWFDREPDRNCQTCRERRRYETALFYGVTTLLFFSVHQHVPLDTWSHWNSRTPLYVAYFVFGLLAGRGNYLHREWLREERAWPRARFWMPLAVVVLGAYLINRVAIPDGRRTETGVQVATALLFNGTALSWLMVSIIAARTVLQRCSARWERLARNSYGVFFLFPLILYPLVSVVRPLRWMPATVGFVLVVLVTTVIAWLLVEVGRHTPGLRRFFGAGTQVRTGKPPTTGAVR